MFSIPYLVSFAFLFFTPKEECLIISKQEFIIEGTTSIGKFKCVYDAQEKDTLAGASLAKGTEIKYLLPGKEFGCGNFILNGDFRKTIRVKEYPTTQIELLSIKKKGVNYSCDVLLTLAGKQKIYKHIELVKNSKTIKSSFLVNFSDFDLVTPKKMSGMIKVKNEVNLSIILHTE